jgi:hypothetical protein
MDKFVTGGSSSDKDEQFKAVRAKLSEIQQKQKEQSDGPVKSLYEILQENRGRDIMLDYS